MDPSKLLALLKQQRAIYDDVKNIEKNSSKRELRANTIKERLDKLQGLWNQFKDNHEKILLTENKEDKYFKEDFYTTVHQKVIQVKTMLEEIVESKDRNAESVESKSVDEKITESQIEKNKINNLVEQYNNNIARLRQMLENLDHYDTVTRLEQLNRIWKRKFEDIRSIYKKLVIEMSYNEVDIMNDYDEIEDQYDKALDELANKMEKLREGNNVKLDCIRIPNFNGNIEEWSSFHDLYKRLIHEDGKISNVEKMYRLKTLVKGEASKLIQHLPVSELNYAVAWEILSQRYENERMLFTILVDKLLDQPSVYNDSASSLKKLLDTSIECIQGLKAMGIKTNEADPIIARIIIRKLDKEGLRLYEQNIKRTKEIQKLDDVLQFLEQQYQAAEAIKSKKQTNNVKSFQKTTATTIVANDYQCFYCNKKGHMALKCYEFLKLQVKDKNTWVKDAKICRVCLSHKTTKRCNSKTKCQDCGKWHNTLLHINSGQNNNTSTLTMNTGTAENVLLATAQVRVKSVQGEMIMLRALIDQGSQTTAVSEEAAQILNLPRKKVKMEVQGLGGTPVGVAKAKINLQIHPRFTSKYKINAEALILPSLVSCQPDKTFSYNIDKWENMTLADPNFNKSDRIDIIIGSDLYGEILEGGLLKKDKILAQSTKFGWILSGILQAKRSIKGFISSNVVNIEKFWEIEEIPEDEDSSEDGYCMKNYAATTTKNEDGRFVVELPFKEEHQLGDSYKMAMARFINLERKLQANPSLKREYVEFMKEYLADGHMKKVSSKRQGKYYLPHQAVVRANSITTKVRVVFDASAKTTNKNSLNDVLYVGPRLQRDIFDILLKFRLKKFAIVADIEKMYRQIWVSKNDQKYQHILWRSEINQPIEEYKLTTVTYGIAPASFLAIRTLFEIANECQDNQISKIIKDDFYMDDLLTGGDTKEECKSVRLRISAHLEKYGFHLRKWCSNSMDIIETVEKSKDNEVIDIDKEESIKTLGLQWNPNNDIFMFKIAESRDVYITKRMALSYLGKIFDPLGLLAPVTVLVKLFVQKLWISNLD
ncbi:uncharacterized protein LOC119688843 [Teleopsis dalmanni]|uniref:uncharacterized protein LOC119688843 n=1 Tax=Teleopsis dalmanni TaxID=139649 RepID=UPI0018CF02D5|nr:uncharacterized protein LOC119688843 [Teleopsis dalmanni]